MNSEVENKPADIHPKISRFLAYSGIFLSIFFFSYTLIFGFDLGMLAWFMIGISYALMGLRYCVSPQYLAWKRLEILTFIVGALGVIALCCNLIFNVLPKM